MFFPYYHFSDHIRPSGNEIYGKIFKQSFYRKKLWKKLCLSDRKTKQLN